MDEGTGLRPCEGFPGRDRHRARATSRVARVRVRRCGRHRGQVARRGLARNAVSARNWTGWTGGCVLEGTLEVCVTRQCCGPGRRRAPSHIHLSLPAFARQKLLCVPPYCSSLYRERAGVDASGVRTWRAYSARRADMPGLMNRHRA
jgi:hypothetical protein